MFSLTRFFTNFSIGKKLAIGFAILIALSVINGLTGIRSLGNYGSSAEAMAGASDIQSALQAARLEEKNFLLTGDVRHADQARQYLQQGISIIEELGASHTGEQLQSLDSIPGRSPALQRAAETAGQHPSGKGQAAGTADCGGACSGSQYQQPGGQPVCSQSHFQTDAKV